MPDLIRHPVPFWILAFARMTALAFLNASLIKTLQYSAGFLILGGKKLNRRRVIFSFFLCAFAALRE